MKKIIFFALVTVFISACQKKEVNIPENVLKKKEMAAILTDLHIAQASMNNMGRVDSSLYSMNDYTTYILKEHKTSKKDFLISMKFYSDHPELLQEVYDSVMTSLSRVEVSTEK